jgi:hypothetical protein
MKDRLNTLENLVSSFLSGDTVIRAGADPDRGFDRAQSGRATNLHPIRRGNEPIQSDPATSSHSTAEHALTPETLHLQKTGDGQVNYIDRSHWQSILEDIKEVREYLTIPNQPLPQGATNHGTDRVLADASYLFGSMPSVQFTEILSSLPPQPVCDKLVSWYFSTQIFVVGKTDFYCESDEKANSENPRNCAPSQVPK